MFPILFFDLFISINNENHANELKKKKRIGYEKLILYLV